MLYFSVDIRRKNGIVRKYFCTDEILKFHNHIFHYYSGKDYFVQEWCESAILPALKANYIKIKQL